MCVCVIAAICAHSSAVHNSDTFAGRDAQNKNGADGVATATRRETAGRPISGRVNIFVVVMEKYTVFSVPLVRSGF